MTSSKHPDTLELRTPSVRLAETPAGLPDVPGGWTQKEWTIEGHVFQLILPAAPDDFLDDAEVHAAVCIFTVLALALQFERTTTKRQAGKPTSAASSPSSYVV